MLKAWTSGLESPRTKKLGGCYGETWSCPCSVRPFSVVCLCLRCSPCRAKVSQSGILAEAQQRVEAGQREPSVKREPTTSAKTTFIARGCIYEPDRGRPILANRGLATRALQTAGSLSLRQTAKQESAGVDIGSSRLSPRKSEISGVHDIDEGGNK